MASLEVFFVIVKVFNQHRKDLDSRDEYELIILEKIDKWGLAGGKGLIGTYYSLSSNVVTPE